MNPILLAILAVTVIGVICAVFLAVASKIMAVPENELAKQIRACLPGANCGACGYAGCDGYAKALAEEKGIQTNLCVPGADTVSRQLSDLLGVEFQDVVEQVAMVKCRGDWIIAECRVAPLRVCSIPDTAPAPMAALALAIVRLSVRSMPSALRTALRMWIRASASAAGCVRKRAPAI